MSLRSTFIIPDEGKLCRYLACALLANSIVISQAGAATITVRAVRVNNNPIVPTNFVVIEPLDSIQAEILVSGWGTELLVLSTVQVTLDNATLFQGGVNGTLAPWHFENFEMRRAGAYMEVEWAGRGGCSPTSANPGMSCVAVPVVCSGGTCVDGICTGGANAGSLCATADNQCVGGACVSREDFVFFGLSNVLVGVDTFSDDPQYRYGATVLLAGGTQDPSACDGGSDAGAPCEDDGGCPGGSCNVVQFYLGTAVLIASWDADGQFTLGATSQPWSFLFEQFGVEANTLNREPLVIEVDGCNADSDSDGVVDCYDGCIHDPAKTEPGICGCGVADVNHDGDPFAECQDDCDDWDPDVFPGATELCDGKDNDCDHVIDNPTAVSEACSDDDVCNGQEDCHEGFCVLGVPLDCDDSNPCTDDACDSALGCSHSDNAASCDDGDACTDPDTCAGGSCQPGVVLDCDDGDYCTIDQCDATHGCINTPVDAGVLCDDDIACTRDECDAVLGCQSVDNCAGGQLCDVETGGCVDCLVDLHCDDGVFCNGNEVCSHGMCMPGLSPSCDDGLDCTVDVCNAATDVCNNTPDNAACDDSWACNGAESCDPISGCQAGTPLDCSDGLTCTVDTCVETDPPSCNHVPTDALCDDGLYCTGVERCDPLSDCQPGTPIDCEDGINCTLDLCDEDQRACANAARDSLCDDGRFCNGAETCDAQLGCRDGTPPDCDDGIDCTLDTCDEVNTPSCYHVPDDAMCDDGDPCTFSTCSGATGCTTAPVDCDDNNACTTDSCDPATGSCQNAPIDCDDLDECTVDSCDEDAGCVYSPRVCDDGVFCNGIESCTSLLGCQAGTPPDCDDDVVCTIDSCNESNTPTCDHTADDAACDDNIACTEDLCSPTQGCRNLDICPSGEVCNVQTGECETGGTSLALVALDALSAVNTASVLPAEGSEFACSVGEHFWLELWARTTNPSGLAQVSADIKFDPHLLRAVNISQSSRFPLFANGAVDNIGGLLDNVSGSVMPTEPPCSTQVGAFEWERVAIVEMQVKNAGAQLIRTAESEDPIFVIADCGSFVLPEVTHASLTVTSELSVPDPIEPGADPCPLSRYLRFAAPASTGGDEVLRVSIVDLDGFPTPSPNFLYVGMPFEAPDENGSQPDVTFAAAPLSCQPVFHDWSQEGILAVYGAEIMPGSQYVVQRAAASCPDLSVDGCWSTPMTLTTAIWGDVAPPFGGPLSPPEPDFADIAALVEKFLGTPGAPTKTTAQLQPNVVLPLHPVSFADIAACVDGFLQVHYASRHSGPCLCPPSVTCGETPCAHDSDCTAAYGGLCVRGYCADACGRCGS